MEPADMGGVAVRHVGFALGAVDPIELREGQVRLPSFGHIAFKLGGYGAPRGAPDLPGP